MLVLRPISKAWEDITRHTSFHAKKTQLTATPTHTAHLDSELPGQYAGGRFERVSETTVKDSSERGERVTPSTWWRGKGCAGLCGTGAKRYANRSVNGVMEEPTYGTGICKQHEH